MGTIQYSYYNPVTYTDPDGKCVRLEGGQVDCVGPALTNQTLVSQWMYEDWRAGRYGMAAAGLALATANVANVAAGFAAQALVEPGNAIQTATRAAQRGDYETAIAKALEAGLVIGSTGLLTPAKSAATVSTRAATTAARVPKVTEKGLARVEEHLDDVLRYEDLPRRMQAGERGMLERLRSGKMSSQDMEFYMHELKESAVFRRTGDLAKAHQEALRYRGVTEKDLFHPEVIEQNSQLFNQSWRSK